MELPSTDDRPKPSTLNLNLKYSTLNTQHSTLHPKASTLTLHPQRTALPQVELSSNASDTRGIRKAITSGYFYHTALLQRSGNYRTLKKPQTVFLHPQGALAKAQPPPRLVVYFELVRTSKDFMRTVSETESDWLVEIAPHLYKPADVEAADVKKMPHAKAKALAADA